MQAGRSRPKHAPPAHRAHHGREVTDGTLTVGFGTVLLVLGEAHSPVMTRELLYTGITRARARMAICGAGEAFKAAVERQLQRTSGLREALWG